MCGVSRKKINWLFVPRESTCACCYKYVHFSVVRWMKSRDTREKKNDQLVSWSLIKCIYFIYKKKDLRDFNSGTIYMLWCGRLDCIIQHVFIVANLFTIALSAYFLWFTFFFSLWNDETFEYSVYVLFEIMCW